VHVHNIYKMVAIDLRETNHCFLENEYWVLLIFLFSLSAEITFFLCSEYGQISIVE